MSGVAEEVTLVIVGAAPSIEIFRWLKECPPFKAGRSKIASLKFMPP